MLPRAAAHAFVADLDSPAIDERDVHHLVRVLRLRPGEAVTVSDGDGRWRSCRWQGAGLAVDGPVHEEPPPASAVTVGFALTKGQRPEWVVQKLTEVGVDRIVLVTAARSVVRWTKPKLATAMERFEQVIRDAAMQSRRVRLPAVEGVLTVAEAVARLGPAVAMAEPGGEAPSLGCPAVLIGPEGGWTAEELATCAHTVGLGPTVLRAETAAVAAGVRLCALREASSPPPATS